MEIVIPAPITDVDEIQNLVENYLTSYDMVNKVKDDMSDERSIQLENIISSNKLEEIDENDCFVLKECLEFFIKERKLHKSMIGTIRIDKTDGKLFIVTSLSKHGRFKIRYVDSSSYSSRGIALNNSVPFEYKIYSKMYAEAKVREAERTIEYYGEKRV